MNYSLLGSRLNKKYYALMIHFLLFRFTFMSFKILAKEILKFHYYVNLLELLRSYLRIEISPSTILQEREILVQIFLQISELTIKDLVLVHEKMPSFSSILLADVTGVSFIRR